MTFDEVLAQVLDLLQRQGRVSYRALKRRFDLDDEYLEDLKAEIIQAQRLAVDEDGVVLVWSGEIPPQQPSPAALVPQREAQTAIPEDRATPDSPLVAEREVSDAERRQLTVLFCDLADSTTLAGQLDPEDLREVIQAYQATCAEVVQRFDGHIAQYLGDGLLVYFGYPQAHEDDASRAVRAGLSIVEALGTLNARLGRDRGIRLAVRVGIHTGLVVVGALGGGDRHEHLALGETPNIAARLQSLAAPDTVVISAATHQLVQGLFSCQELHTPSLKGVAQPLAVYYVRGVSEAQSRFEVAISHGLTPLVGREEEVGLLRRRWEQATEGHGQVVLLSGEAGIGKSRLVQELREHVGPAGMMRMTFRCSPYAQHSALYPMIEHLQRFLQWQREDTPETKLATLERVLQGYHLPLHDVVPLFAALLSLPPPAHYPLLALSPQQQQQQTQAALLAWLMEETERQPLLMVWEDLHWADASTLEWLGLLIDQAPTTRLLTLLTYRPEFRPPWASRSHLTQLTLSRFTRPQGEAMVTRVASGKALPGEVLQQIVAKTDGVPLFVEELTKMVLESGLLQEHEDHYALTGPLPPLAIPTTLHDSLMARLDRLATVREVAQLGATLGREFTYELLQAVWPLDEETLQRGLRRLVDAELIYQRGVPPQARYVFKHALIQEAAYQALLKSTRQRYHQQIAQVLESRFPDIVKTQPELLAHHYTEAGLSAKAVGYWRRAGQRALAGSFGFGGSST
jgi:class 3 adenylate cyclase